MALTEQIRVASLRTTPAPDSSPARIGTLGLGTPRIPTRVDPYVITPLSLPASVVVIGHRNDPSNGAEVCTFEREVETAELEYFIGLISEETEAHREARLPADWRVRLAEGEELGCDGGVVISRAP